MTPDTSKPGSESHSAGAPAAAGGASVARDAKSEQMHPGSESAPPKGGKATRMRRLLIGLLGILV